MWPDESWEMNSGEAACDGMGPYESQFSDQDGYFSCGPTAASLLACKVDGSGGSAICIQNLDGKQAARLKDPSVAGYSDPASSSTTPLRVGLDNGVTCSFVSHDHAQHWNGWFSWFPCTDGSELLVSDVQAGSTETFDRSSKTWTAQVSRNKGKPTKEPVLWAEFAGQK